MIESKERAGHHAGSSYMRYFMLRILCLAIGFGVISKVYRES
jgi:hypothetical protein